MGLSEIKTAVESGKTVCYQTHAYQVVKDSLGRWQIACQATGHRIGLTWSDGQTLNGKPEDFYTLD